MSRQHCPIMLQTRVAGELLFGFTTDSASISGFVRVSGFQFLRVDSHVFAVRLVLIFALASTVSDIIAHFKILGGV